MTGARKVLIVEDETSILMALEDDLTLDGFEVETASDGLTGLRKATESEPDLVILDVMLPGLDGFEVCRRLRAEGVQVPILMLTAKSQEVDKVLGLELGADDYALPRTCTTGASRPSRRSWNSTAMAGGRTRTSIRSFGRSA